MCREKRGQCVRADLRQPSYRTVEPTRVARPVHRCALFKFFCFAYLTSGGNLCLGKGDSSGLAGRRDHNCGVRIATEEVTNQLEGFRMTISEHSVTSNSGTYCRYNCREQSLAFERLSRMRLDRDARTVTRAPR
jgi:hypothetical protein